MEPDGIHEQVAAYALDALSEPERAEFEQHLGSCTVCKEELESLRAAAAALAHAVESPSPPPALRERILERARREREGVVPLRRRFLLPASTVLATAAAAAAVALAIWTGSLSDSLSREQAIRRSQTHALALLTSPGARHLSLAGARGELVVTPERDAALVVLGLPPAPRNRTYEAWVITKGSPRPAGLFAGGRRAILALERPVPRGAQVAVTMEPAGGSDLPSGAIRFRSERA